MNLPLQVQQEWFVRLPNSKGQINKVRDIVGVVTSLTLIDQDLSRFGIQSFESTPKHYITSEIEFVQQIS